MKIDLLVGEIDELAVGVDRKAARRGPGIDPGELGDDVSDHTVRAFLFVKSRSEDPVD